jgi:hypothetical protein
LKPWLAIVAVICLLSVTGGVLVLLRDLHQGLADADRAIVQMSTDLHGTSQNANAALLQIGLTTDELRRAAGEQRLYWNQTSKQTEKTVAALRQLIDRTDKNLNDHAFPAVNALLKESNAWLNLTADDADKLTAAGNATLDAATHSLDTLNQQIADPHIIETLGHLDDAMQAFADASKHADHTVAYYDQQLTRPAGFFKTLLKGFFGFGSEAAEIRVGFAK